MTAGILGNGAHSTLGDLRAKQRRLQYLLAHPLCIGRHQERRIRTQLKTVAKRIKALNAELREARQLRQALAAERMFLQPKRKLKE